MILVSVIVGYILGIAPFIVPKTIEKIELGKSRKVKVEEDKTTTEIINEWLNGPQENNKINQADIYNEYITGKESVKGD